MCHCGKEEDDEDGGWGIANHVVGLSVTGFCQFLLLFKVVGVVLGS